MQLFLRFIFVSVFVLSAMSCGKDDSGSTPIQEEQSPVEEGLPPSNFALNFDLDFTSVAVSWSVETGENNLNLKYDIFVDDDLIIQNGTEMAYNLYELEAATTYQLLVIAKNLDGETSIASTFETLDIANFKVGLRSYLPQFNAESFSIEYNHERNPYMAESSYETGTDYSFSYAPDGTILRQTGFGIDYRSTTHISYIENRLDVIVYEIRNNGGEDREVYTYIDSNNYTFYRRIIDATGPTEEFTEFISVVRDDEGRITHYTAVDENNVINNELAFEYTDGNLTKLIRLPNNISTEFTYDDKYNFNTINAFKDKYIHGYLSGISWYIPEIHNFLNKNNLLEVKSNGTAVLTYSYEYNDFDYPVIRTASDGREWLFDYVLFEN